MQYGTYCGIRKAREDTVRLNLIRVRSLEGLDALCRLGLEGFLLFMYPNFILFSFSSGLLTAWRAEERFFVEYFGFLFDNISLRYLVFASFFPYSLPFNYCCDCD